MAKVKTTIYVDEDVLRDVRVAAAREGRAVSDLVEEALKGLTLKELFAQVSARFDLDPEEAERIAVEEVRAYRREQVAD